MAPVTSTPTAPPATRPVRVWDLPTRLFHWLLALCIVGLVVSGTVGGNALVWHMRIGLTVLALLSFRVLWGVAGGAGRGLPALCVDRARYCVTRATHSGPATILRWATTRWAPDRCWPCWPC